MKPKILIIGAVQSNLDHLATQLQNEKRMVLVVKNSEEKVRELLKTKNIDWVVIEPNQQPILELIQSINNSLPIEIIALDDWQRIDLLIDQQSVAFEQNEPELLTVEK